MKSYNIYQEKPLYVWKVGKDFKIRKYIINEYTLSEWHGRRQVRFYHCLGSQSPSGRYFYMTNENKFNYGVVFSFENNDEKAYATIFENYKDKTAKAKHQYDLAEKQWVEVLKANGKKL